MEFNSTDPPPPPRPSPSHHYIENPPRLIDLAAALEDATLYAELLSSNPFEIFAAIASFRTAHQILGSVLSHLQPRPPVGNGDQPMADRLEEKEGGGNVNERSETDGVETGMRDKGRKKRRASPSFLSGLGDALEEEIASVEDGMTSALDLVLQFYP
ncbi:hypothetical protein J5N97_029338 [Dioscorea zingiberensis]|uniref:Uncharacterized protein n=1 Tax=Dioscorea zingiberensis TaxID=325984 RepID=A0A9D5H5J1_9LILI|nr:hypothetical protein J5N97_029338 [Dioscorea zingiberensis]